MCKKYTEIDYSFNALAILSPENKKYKAEVVIKRSQSVSQW